VALIIMPTLLGRAAGAASSIIAAIAGGEEQPAAAGVAEASVGQEFQHSSVASANGSESEVGEWRKESFLSASSSESEHSELAAASTTLHPRKDSGSGGTGIGGSTTDRLLKVLDGLEAEMKASDEKENTYWEHANTKVLLDSRDKVQEKLERLGDKIRGLEQNNRKRKTLISQYKRSRHEYVLFEHQLSQAMGIEVNPDIEKDDASFLEEDDV
jgi:hypothetical protein